MKTTKEMIEVMQAFERGEAIEWQEIDCRHWNWHLAETPGWDWYHLDYRIAEKPKKEKVKMWLWLMKNNTEGYYPTPFYSAHQPTVFPGVTVIGKIENTMIEVEE